MGDSTGMYRLGVSYAEQEVPLGQTCEEDGIMYEYVRFAENISATTQTVFIDAAGEARALADADVNTLGYAVGWLSGPDGSYAGVSGEYGWAARMGNGITYYTQSSVVVNAPLYTTTGTGRIDDTGGTSIISGAYAANTEGSSATAALLNAACPAFVAP